jgi:hypothetical protein
MEKVGKIHGDGWSEVKNIHSRPVYPPDFDDIRRFISMLCWKEEPILIPWSPIPRYILHSFHYMYMF